MISALLRALDSPRWPDARVDTPAGTLLPHGLLDLSRKPLSVQGAVALSPALRRNPALRAINLSGASLSDDALHALFSPDLGDARWERIHLGANPLSPEATDSLAHSLASLSSLRALLLKRTRVSAKGARAFASLPHLRTLDLASCGLGPEALAALSRALPESSLECLFLSANPVSFECSEELSRALPFSSLRALHLGHCALSTHSLGVLSSGLSRSTELRVLDLASNGLSPSAARPLAALIAQGQLRELRLGRVAWTEHTSAPANALGDEGLRVISSALAHNRSITHLDLAHNQFSLGALREFVTTLQAHPTLATVHLGASLPAELLYQLVALSCRNAPARAESPAWRADLYALRSASALRRAQPDGTPAGALSALDDDDLYAHDLRPRPRAPDITDPPRDFSEEELATTARVLRSLLSSPRLLGEAHPELGDLRALCLSLTRAARSERERSTPAAPRALVRSVSRRRPARSPLGPESAPESTSDGAAALPREGLAPRTCYVCKQPATERHPAYRSLCYPCGALSFVKRQQSTRLPGRVCLVTGARVKVGYEVALKLLRAGATVIATSRFARDAARRFAKAPDFNDFKARLRVQRLDLRFIPEVERFALHLAQSLPRLDVIVHNAAQTVRRPEGYWAALEALEAVERESLPETLRALCPESFESPRVCVDPSALALVQGDLMALAKDPLDDRPMNSWRMRLDEVSTQEVVEVHAVNAIAPYVLTARLRALMARSPETPRFIVNVSAVEGQFYRQAKGAAHPHTNMAKAALNMLTRTVAQDLARDEIYMNSVDTGWLSNDNPLAVVERMAAAGFEPPLDAIDAAARVLDPVFSGARSGECVWGLFLKDFRAAPW